MSDDTDKLGPWTIKNVSQETRTAINDAAKRSLMTVGQWLTETANLRISGAKFTRVEPHLSAAAPVAAQGGPPSLPDLADLIRAMPGLAGVPGMGGVARAARKVAVQGLSAYLPPQEPRPARTALAAPVED